MVNHDDSIAKGLKQKSEGVKGLPSHKGQKVYVVDKSQGGTRGFAKGLIGDKESRRKRAFSFAPSPLDKSTAAVARFVSKVAAGQLVEITLKAGQAKKKNKMGKGNPGRELKNLKTIAVVKEALDSHIATLVHEAARAGVPQRDIAEAIGTSQSTIHRELRPKPVYTQEMERLLRLASVFRDQPDDREGVIAAIAAISHVAGELDRHDDEFYYLGARDLVVAAELAGELSEDEVDRILTLSGIAE